MYIYCKDHVERMALCGKCLQIKTFLLGIEDVPSPFFSTCPYNDFGKVVFSYG